nr:DNA-processing protein DprA [Phaeovibrio sulfidiphilus]
MRLFRSENVGPVTWRQLMSVYGSATAAIRAVPDLARRGGKRAIRICPVQAVEDEKKALTALGAKLLFLGDPAYPPLLAALDDAPPVLTVLGTPDLLRRPVVAIVGARNASANGCRFAERLARELGEAGLVVVSGLARGIDSAAHAGSLETGTVAVMAGGVDVVYPAENAGLYESIRGAGALVSELPPGVKPFASHFPRRNRIVSGLALGIVVVEAAARSGSLLSARLALEQGREVMAVPGSPLDARARGPNSLIRSGAALVESAHDVLEVLEPYLSRPVSEPDLPRFQGPASGIPPENELEDARERVCNAFDETPIPVDELIRRCQMSPLAVSVVLLELELAGRLTRHPGNRVSRPGPQGPDA